MIAHVRNWLTANNYDKFKIIKIERDFNEHSIYIIEYLIISILHGIEDGEYEKWKYSTYSFFE